MCNIFFSPKIGQGHQGLFETFPSQERELQGRAFKIPGEKIRGALKMLSIFKEGQKFSRGMKINDRVLQHFSKLISYIIPMRSVLGPFGVMRDDFWS